MALSTIDFVKARDTVAELLDELALEAYLFEVEPRNSHWEVKVECAITEGWETVTLSIPKEVLLASADDKVIRKQVLEEWRARLAACKIQSS
ncbi:hypothetical protein Nhal_0453 [Nitrosococcus halophilus Nc 4]|uniref:Uncharacterized protein n=1 Tax=Nitrosococcus halophilus (strain Nc4) TaxID=472759 RepID=D5BVL1_NITHN|nr:hypothetical protein [Nitrosococcus halophilus]ADE13639.1 hypothetical protein Nhal_0453 [Nitrosococcus halophilus Nc 4]